MLGGNWLLLVGIPLIIGLMAQLRVSSAFKKWGEVRASSNITGAEAAREILQAAQISDVEVVEIERLSRRPLRSDATNGFVFRPTFTTRRRWRRSASPRMRPATPFSTPKLMRR